jgi:hypothetical protein
MYARKGTNIKAHIATKMGPHMLLRVAVKLDVRYIALDIRYSTPQPLIFVDIARTPE